MSTRSRTRHPCRIFRGDHADHEYLITPNSAGDGVVWTHGIDDALQENAADIGAADRRIDDIVMPTFGVPYPQDNFAYMLEGCEFNVDLNKEECETKWHRPAMWEYVKIAEHTFNDWSAFSNDWSFGDSTFDLHAELESTVTAFRRYVLNAGWSTTNSGQVTAHYQMYEIGGMPPRQRGPAPAITSRSIR